MRTEPVVYETDLDHLSTLPTSSMSERDLYAAGLGLMRPRLIEESCVCGGVIRAEDYDEDIRAAVAVHNRTPLHGQWRERMR